MRVQGRPWSQAKPSGSCWKVCELNFKKTRRWQDKSRGPDRAQAVVGVGEFPARRASRSLANTQFLGRFNALSGTVRTGSYW